MTRPSTAPDAPVCILTSLAQGHHRSYRDTVAILLDRAGIHSVTTASPQVALRHRGPLLILMAEEHPIASYTLAGARAAVGRRTAALLFRPREALTGSSVRLRTKRALLRALRWFDRVSFLTIVPHALIPGLARLSRSWIDDPQLWDLTVLGQQPGVTDLACEVRQLAGDRAIILCAGLLDAHKGLAMVAALARDPEFTARFAILCAGRLSGTDAAELQTNPHCIVIDRYLTDEELLSLYPVADLVWAAYAPSYDQASGIFGRAVQLGRPVIVRRASLMQGYAVMLDVPAIVLDWMAPAALVAQALQSAVEPVPPPSLAERNRDVLIMALFGVVR